MEENPKFLAYSNDERSFIQKHSTKYFELHKRKLIYILVFAMIKAPNCRLIYKQGKVLKRDLKNVEFLATYPGLS